MSNKPLPIGSVVRLNGGTKRLMIIGYLRYASEDKSVIADYSGCLYPEGFVSKTENYLFNHENIDSIYALGYCDQAQEQFTISLLESFKNAKGKMNFG
jgi:hypothetical protein